MKTSNTLRILWLLGSAVAIGACRQDAVQEERPARIVDPTAEGRAELQRAVSDMLSGAEVTLAETALTDASVLIVERKAIRGIDVPPLSGRDLGRPHRFQLVTTGTACVLIHEQSGSRAELTRIACTAE